jgi:nicotinamidase-related amidase
MHALGWPVIFIKIGRRADGVDNAQASSGRRLRPMPAEAHYMEMGSWGTQFIEGIAPEERDIVLEKKGNSAFGLTPLHRVLRNLGVRRCILTGGAISGCLSDTVREGIGLGYDLTVVSDATYPAHSPYLDVLAERTEVKPTAAVLAGLPETAARSVEVPART